MNPPITSYYNELWNNLYCVLDCVSKALHVYKHGEPDAIQTVDTSNDSLWNDADPTEYRSHRITCAKIIINALEEVE